MSDNQKFVKADGTLLSGREAEHALAEHDASQILKNLGLDGDLPKEATSRDSRSKADREAEERTLNKQIASVSPQINNDAQDIWKFSKGAEDYVFHFRLDLDPLWAKTFGVLSQVHEKINEVGSTIFTHLDMGAGKVDSAADFLTKWGDMSENIRRGTNELNDTIQAKTDEVTGFTKNLNDRAQTLAKSATNTLNNPYLKNVVDTSAATDSVNDMAGTSEYLTTTFNSFVDDKSKTLQGHIAKFTKMITSWGESSGLFSVIKEASGELVKLLNKVSDLIRKIREKIGSFLGKLNGLFEKIFTCLGKITSFIECFLGLDIGLMKEALKNGTIRLTDVRLGALNTDVESEVKTVSSTELSAAKITAGNVSAAVKVTDNSKSGHVEVQAIDVKAGNLDTAVVREGKFKRNLAYVKGANINAANVRGTLVDNREGDTTVVGAAAAEVNAFNVEAYGLGREGKHHSVTAQPSLSVGNVAIGVRRSRSQNVNVGPKFSAFNVDLTVGRPSLTNFLNQLGPGQGFGNITIPFLGGGGGEAGGTGKDKDDGQDGQGDGQMDETAGESTYGLAKDRVEYGDRLPQKGGRPFPGGTSKGGGQLSGGTSKSQQTPGSEGSGHMSGRFDGEQKESQLGNQIGSINTGSSGYSDTKTSRSPSISASYNGKDNGSEGSGSLLDARLPGTGARFTKGGTGLLSGSTTETHSTMHNLHLPPSSGSNTTEDNVNTRKDAASSHGSTNALGSGVYKTGDGLGKKDDDDYQSKLVSLVKGRVNDKTGKKPQKDIDSTKKSKDPSTFDKNHLKRLLLSECQEELEKSEGGQGCSEDASSRTATQKSRAKPKRKPWGEHGNIHGFSTLTMDSDKELKKLGDGIWGFGDS